MYVLLTEYACPCDILWRISTCLEAEAQMRMEHLQLQMKSINSVLVSETLRLKCQIEFWIITMRVTLSSNVLHHVYAAKMKWKVPLYVGIPPAHRHGHTAFIFHSHVSVSLNNCKMSFVSIMVSSFELYVFLVCALCLLCSCLFLVERMKSRSLMTWKWWSS